MFIRFILKIINIDIFLHVRYTAFLHLNFDHWCILISKYGRCIHHLRGKRALYVDIINLIFTLQNDIEFSDGRALCLLPDMICDLLIFLVEVFDYAYVSLDCKSGLTSPPLHIYILLLLWVLHICREGLDRTLHTCWRAVLVAGASHTREVIVLFLIKGMLEGVYCFGSDWELVLLVLCLV